MPEPERIAVLCPTRNRPDNVVRLIESGRATAVHPPDFVFYLDHDDPTAAATWQYVKGIPGAQCIMGARIVLSQMWNACYDRTSADIVMHCGDDIVFRTDGWDDMVRAAFAEVPDRILFVHGNDLIQGERIGTHGFLHRAWIDAVGYMVPPYFSSDWNDAWLTEVADKIRRRVYLPDLITEHMHPIAGKGPMDVTHIERLERHRTDDVDRRYAELAPEREADATKLLSVIAAGGVSYAPAVDNPDPDPGRTRRGVHGTE